MGWGAGLGLVSGSVQIRRAWQGLVFGAGVWVQSYTVLVPAKLYEPPWGYDAVTLWKDLNAHLVYGLATSTALRALTKATAAERACRSGWGEFFGALEGLTTRQHLSCARDHWNRRGCERDRAGLEGSVSAHGVQPDV